MITLLFVSAALAGAWLSLIRAPQAVRHTTLQSAGRWALAAAGLWSTAWLLDSVGRRVSISVADHLWYAAAVFALCPSIAVLGSRRPGTRVWTGFILIPMLFALAWPVLTLWAQGSDVRGLQLETPQLVGYVLVLIMGAGNYFGTRHSFSALFYFAGNLLLVLSSSVVCPPSLADRWWSRVWATGCLSAAVILAGRSVRHTSNAVTGIDRLWLDFLDQFGIVWGRRIQDRVNFVALQEHWPARLELQGVVWDSAPDTATQARMEHAFRWLLRRFVDPPWIDERLGRGIPEGDPGTIGADS